MLPLIPIYLFIERDIPGGGAVKPEQRSVSIFHPETRFLTGFSISHLLQTLRGRKGGVRMRSRWGGVRFPP